MRIPPTASESPHALHLTASSKAGSAAALRVGGAAVGTSPDEHPVPGLADAAPGARAYYAPASGGARSYYAPASGGARSYYAAEPGKLDVYA